MSGGERREICIRDAASLEPVSGGAHSPPPQPGPRHLLRKGGGCDVPKMQLAENARQLLRSPITALLLTSQERHLVVAMQGGELAVLVLDAEYLRQRLQQKLESLGL